MQWQGEIKWVRLVKECLHNEYGRWTYIARKVNRYKVWFRYKSSGSRASHNWSLYWRWTWENWSLLGWPRATGRRSSRSGIRQVNIVGTMNRYEGWCCYKNIGWRASLTYMTTKYIPSPGLLWLMYECGRRSGRSDFRTHVALNHARKVRDEHRVF